MQTGNRWAGGANPRDVTGSRTRELLREKQDREKAADIDIEAVRREAYDAAFEPAYVAGAQWALNVLREAGVDVDSVLSLDDDDQGDEDVVE